MIKAQNISISVAYVLQVIRHAARLGHDPADLLRAAGISPLLLSQDQSRVTAIQYSDLMRVVMLRMQDEMLGYAPRRLLPGAWNIVCHSLIHCQTLGHALRRFCKFFGLFEWGLRPRSHSVGELVAIKLHPAEEDWSYDFFACELILFLIHRLCSWLIREHIPLRAVHFTHSAPPYAAELRHSFLACPVRFNQLAARLEFHQQFLDRRIKQNEATLNAFLRSGHYEMLVTQYPHVSWTAKIRELAADDLTAIPSFEAIANALRTHPQTLRRRLADEGVTYNELKNDLRRDMAIYLLTHDGPSIDEIAAAIGFSQASAFTRAFKLWTGLTPGAYREIGTRP